MRKLILSLAATPLILGSIAVSAQAADDAAVKADSGFNIFSDVKFKGELRPRYEFRNKEGVKNTDGSDKAAGSAITNKTNLNFSANLFELEGLNGEMELNAVNDFGSEQQTDAQHGNESRGNVAKISQANISYTAAGATGILGRKGVNLDNQRFIGTVGWKQNMQSYDLAAVAYGIENFNIIGAYVYGVNGITDDGYNYGRGETLGVTGSGSTTSGIINASYKIMDPIKVTGYAYLLGSISDTYGLAATGNVPLGESVKLNYRAEFAMQTKASLKHEALQPKTASKNLGSSYINLDVGANISGILVGLNYEVLGANKDLDSSDLKGKATGYDSFQTPLATKHKFNGWADQFLATPETGLADLNVRAGYKFKSAGKIIAIYHMYAAAADNKSPLAATKISAGDAYGSEFDLAYSVKVPSVNNLGLLVKAAMFKNDDKVNGAKSYNADATLAWVQLDYKFKTK